MPQKKQESSYNKGMKEADRLEGLYDKQANIVQKAYTAAMEELKFSNNDMIDKGKAKQVAKLMFSDKYLGNAGFNPHISDKYASMSETDKDREMEHKLGVNLMSFVGNNGIIDRKGGLRRGSLNDALENHYGNKVASQITAWNWKQSYDPNASLEQNLKNYASVVNQDPILSGSGKQVDPMRFESVDDIAQSLTTAMMGHSTRTGYQYRNGVDFN